MAKNNNVLKDTTGDKIFYAINGFFLLVLALIILYPLYFIIIASISDPDAVLGGEVILYPVRITLEGFSKIMERGDVWRGYLNTINIPFTFSNLILMFAFAASVSLPASGPARPSGVVIRAWRAPLIASLPRPEYPFLRRIQLSWPACLSTGLMLHYLCPGAYGEALFNFLTMIDAEVNHEWRDRDRQSTWRPTTAARSKSCWSMTRARSNASRARLRSRIWCAP